MFPVKQKLHVAFDFEKPIDIKFPTRIDREGNKSNDEGIIFWSAA